MNHMAHIVPATRGNFAVHLLVEGWRHVFHELHVQWRGHLDTAQEKGHEPTIVSAPKALGTDLQSEAAVRRDRSAFQQAVELTDLDSSIREIRPVDPRTYDAQAVFGTVCKSAAWLSRKTAAGEAAEGMR